MRDEGLVAAILGLAFVLSLSRLAGGLLRAYSGTPQAIIRQLQRGRPVVVRLRGARSTWDPSRPLGPGNTRWGPARATYTSDGEMVRLRYEPVFGTPVEVEGPLPDLALRPSRLVWLRLAAYIVALVIAFAVGALVASGSTARRALYGWFAVALAMLLVWFGTLALNVVKAVRDLSRQRRTPAEW